MRDVIILGSTGSIGAQALDVIARNPEQFHVLGLAAGGSAVDVLAEQIERFNPPLVAVADAQAADALRKRLGEHPVRIEAGPEAATHLAGQLCDVVLNGVTGAAGLRPTLAALAAGTSLALANKESLVIGGRLVTDAAAPGQIVAVDSEHSAIAQALRAGRAEEVRKLILTASGGPFRGRTRDELREVTPAQAMAHPTWNMGRVITINSATLVNKGLELLEAGLLYGVALDAIEVVVHPTSDVHSMVEFTDGSTIAQCSPPDMRLPLALALAWPNRVADAVSAYDWRRPITWTFEPLDDTAFPAVALARRVGTASGTAPAVFNAANEVCVDAFCAQKIGFLDIVDTVASIVEEHLASGQHTLDLTVDTVLAADAWARQRATEVCEVAR